jgi:hypothetical protein
MRAVLPLALAMLLSAGCLSAADPPAASEVAVEDHAGRAGRPGDDPTVYGPSGGPETETTAHYAGRILLRPGGEGPGYIEEGNSGQFCFGLPTNVTLLRGVFSYSPRQQAGLEFRLLEDPYTYVNSWDESPAALAPESPITLELRDPAPGHWFTAGGPGSIGGAMEWSLDLTMVTPGAPSEEALAFFETINPAC